MKIKRWLRNEIKRWLKPFIKEVLDEKTASVAEQVKKSTIHKE